MSRIVWQTSSAAAPPVLQLMATSAPACGQGQRDALPIPRELPVTKAFLPEQAEVRYRRILFVRFGGPEGLRSQSSCHRLRTETGG